MAHIFIDNREKIEDRGSPRLYVPAAVEKNNADWTKKRGAKITYSVCNLKLGDYAIMMNGKIGAVFERKTWRDLSASISDGRILTQKAGLINLAKTGVRVYLLIEGREFQKRDKEIGGKTVAQLEANLRHSLLRGLPYIQTSDMMATAQYIVDMARDITRMVHDEGLTLGGEIQTYIDTITWPPENLVDWDWSVWEMKSEEMEVPKELNTITKASDQDVQVSLWQCFPKIGQLRASRLYAAGCRVGDFWRSEKLKTWRDGIAKIVSMNQANEMAILIKQAGEIQADLDNEVPIRYPIAIKQSIDSLSLGILQAVPGIGETQARAILSAYTLVEIARGRVTAAQIAELKTTRRLGQTVGEKVIKFLGPQSGCPF